MKQFYTILKNVHDMQLQYAFFNKARMDKSGIKVQIFIKYSFGIAGIVLLITNFDVFGICNSIQYQVGILYNTH